MFKSFKDILSEGYHKEERDDMEYLKCRKCGKVFVRKFLERLRQKEYQGVLRCGLFPICLGEEEDLVSVVPAESKFKINYFKEL